MSLPAYEAERWRLVDQTLSQVKVDIDRLWRAIRQSTSGTPGSPSVIDAWTGAGSGGGGDGVLVYTLAIRGNAASGSISWSANTGGSPTTGTIAYNADESGVTTALSGFDSGVVCRGGVLKYNAIKIKFTSDVYRLSITNHTLTREANGVSPTVELSYCSEPASWWE